ncbi:phosphatidylserine decarboxylase proenzyme, mitochondrial isoform X1 [Halyomorpha halys]|uniref:phosphatidylserine decarboxylase proenzyme, mitochondrial isoform X1 n=1 Tax=Halyomorpha halys TaxID=286706 RepID=UPI0006D4FD2E|nr:phosphatidylserine decarboxylase proenzyme, mitochondrial isoform X1 [Halyomorpha halys]
MELKASSLLSIKYFKIHVSLRLLVTCLGTLCWFQVGLLIRLTDWTFNAGYKPGLLKRVWDSWVPIPAGVGLSLLAYLQWRRLERERNKGVRVAANWEVSCYKALPLRAFSRAFGSVSETKIPTKLRPFIYGSYAKVFGVNLSEISEPVDNYSCLCEFFTRRLKDGVRPVDQHKAVVSPADGTVMNAGKVSSFQVEQVKGITYSLKAFLGDMTWKGYEKHTVRDINCNEVVFAKDTKTPDNWIAYKKSLLHDPIKNDLYQCVIYLAPGDYHRFHSPADWHVSFRRHFKGELLSVNPSIAQWIPGLFVLNERALYVGTWQHGYFSMTAVGATNVGSIRVYDDKSLHTNTKWCDSKTDTHLDLNWKKGNEIGEFRMGSTIVLLFEAPKDFHVQISPMQRVQVGEGITV